VRHGLRDLFGFPPGEEPVRGMLFSELFVPQELHHRCMPGSEKQVSP
jgi:hypothetical protein